MIVFNLILEISKFLRKLGLKKLPDGSSVWPWGKKWSVQISQYWETLSLTLRSILDAVLYDACVLARQAPAESEISLFVHQQTAVLLADVQSSSPPRQMLGFVQESYKIWGTRPDRSRGSWSRRSERARGRRVGLAVSWAWIDTKVDFRN